MRRIGYGWNLRQIMAARDMHQTSDLIQPLADRGIRLSREQVYRLVTQAPQRLNVEVIHALCDIFECTFEDLSPARIENRQANKAASGGGTELPGSRELKPARRSVIRRPGEQR